MLNTKPFIALTLLALTAASLAGCSKAETGPTAAANSPYRLAAEPAGAKGVKLARKEAKDAEEVTLVGRIGGDAKPWVEGQAAFLIVDSALEPCKDDEGCPTPWDYCCSMDLLPESKAMIKVVDGSGKTVATDARQLLGVKELQTVVVHGRAKRDEGGNLTVLADGIFVRN
jgi:hypothetical protein